MIRRLWAAILLGAATVASATAPAQAQVPPASAASAQAPAATAPAPEERAPRAQSSEALFASGVAALAEQAYQSAIDTFELLADRGFTHPDASYNRALAYLGRARSPAAEPGDLGRAAAALSEAVLLSPSDAEAEVLLDQVRAEIARRRARTGADPVMERPSLGRAAISLLDENVYAIVAILGSLLLSAGLSIRRLGRRHNVRLGAGISAAIGAALFAIGAGLTLASAHLRRTSEPAVVVAPEARLLDESGRPISNKDAAHVVVPEGAAVHLLERRGQLGRIQWGTTEAWVPISQVRVLPRR
ncbi:MAG TPA: hypothetical protein VKZ49_09765 [Polyangiaceae bacterium]|nr:hypothetical protein [Polyangiaceae bacterium]